MCWLPGGGRKGSCRGKLHPTVQSQLAVVCWLARQGTAEAHPSNHGSTGSQGSSRFHSLISSPLSLSCYCCTEGLSSFSTPTASTRLNILRYLLSTACPPPPLSQIADAVVGPHEIHESILGHRCNFSVRSPTFHTSYYI